MFLLIFTRRERIYVYINGNSLSGTGCSFLRAGGSEGDTIRLEGRVLQLGRNMAYTEVKLFDLNNKLLATGLHNKYVTNAINNPKNVKLDDAGRIVSPAAMAESTQ